jgi:hypothetical protein
MPLYPQSATNQGTYPNSYLSDVFTFELAVGSIKEFRGASHYIWVAKCNIGFMTLNPHYLWEAKMLNPYIKHGTFLVEFDDRIKTTQGN